MIKAIFERSDGKFKGFSVSGHSGYSRSGSDIVCASVSSAVMLICNLATETYGFSAEINAGESSISMKSHDDASKLIEALYEHLKSIAEEYPKNITVKISEV